MNEAKTISVVMATSDFYAHTPELFQSLDAQTTDDFHMIIVDDGSLDGCELDSHDRAMVLRNMKRLGFGRALNQAVELSLARWEGEPLEDRFVLVVQPEIILGRDALEKLFACMREGEDRLLASPVLYRAVRMSGIDEEPEIDFTDEMVCAGFEMTKSRELRFTKDIDRLFGPIPECFMIRASALKRLQEKGVCFDESLRRLPALIDLLWRVKLLGGRMPVAKDAIAWKQLVHASEKKMNDEKRQERLVRLELHEVHVKLSPNGLRLRHAPWLFIAWIKRTCAVLLHPDMWGDYLRERSLRFKVAGERAKRFSKLGKRSAQMKDWFV